MIDEDTFNITNFRDHPTNRRYKVFFFKAIDAADYFESLLKENQIIYERDPDTQDGEKILFAVRKDGYKEAVKINFLTSAKFRKPFISNGFLKWFLVLGMLIIIGLGVISYLKS